MSNFRFLLAMLLGLLHSTTAFGQGTRVGELAFFGQEGLDLGVIQSGLPFGVGSPYPATTPERDQWKQAVRDAVKRITGRDAADVSVVCCNEKGEVLVYVGLPGSSSRKIIYNPAPTGERKLSTALLTLSEEIEETMIKAILEGRNAEDGSAGYALARDDVATRTRQLELREYALQNESELMEVLQFSADAFHRELAAQALGYASQSQEQIAALVKASFDADNGVRNNAVRALAVMAQAKPQLRSIIEANRFIDLLASETWSDRNKASFILSVMTDSRDPELLNAIRSEALTPLLEMARWPLGHAYAFLLILGRIGGIEDARLSELINDGKVEEIIRVVQR